MGAKKKYNCPAEMTLQLIGGKWKAILLYNLRKGPKRFGEIKRLSPGITQSTLSKELRELEANGIVRRFSLGREKTEGVEYSLTEVGETLKPILNALIRWGLSNQQAYVQGEYVMGLMRK